MRSAKTRKTFADAAKIVERLRKFPSATIAGFCREYGVKHETMMQAILSVISDAEYYELRRQRKRDRRKKTHLASATAAASRRIKKQQAAAETEARHEAIHKANLNKLRGETTSWYQCKGCGFDCEEPVLPCPKCGHLVFELIAQPVELARRMAMNE